MSCIPVQGRSSLAPGQRSRWRAAWPAAGGMLAPPSDHACPIPYRSAADVPPSAHAPRLRPGRHRHAGAGRRRDHGDVQRRLRRAAGTAADPRRRSPGGRLGPGPRDFARPGRAHLSRRRSARRRQPHRRADGRGRRIDVDGRARRPRRPGTPGVCRRLRCVLRHARGPGRSRTRAATTRRRAGRRQRPRAQPPRLGRSVRQRPGDRRSHHPARRREPDRDRGDAAGLRLPARRRVLDAAGSRTRGVVGDLEDRRARQRRGPDVDRPAARRRQRGGGRRRPLGDRPAARRRPAGTAGGQPGRGDAVCRARRRACPSCSVGAARRGGRAAPHRVRQCVRADRHACLAGPARARHPAGDGGVGSGVGAAVAGGSGGARGRRRRRRAGARLGAHRGDAGAGARRHPAAHRRQPQPAGRLRRPGRHDGRRRRLGGRADAAGPKHAI